MLDSQIVSEDRELSLRTESESQSGSTTEPKHAAKFLTEMQAIMLRQEEPNNQVFFAGYEDRFKRLKILT